MRTKRGVYRAHVSIASPNAQNLPTYRENPLKGERSTPSPLVVTLVESVCGTGDNDLTNRPTHLQRGSASTTERDGDNLTGVCGSVGNEETPRDTFESLSDDEESKRIGLESQYM